MGSRNRKKAKAAAKGGGERAGGGKAKASGFKFHEYTGPSTTTKRSSGGSSKKDEGGSKKSDEETQYELLLKQQQLFLQWQLDLSHQARNISRALRQKVCLEIIFGIRKKIIKQVRNRFVSWNSWVGGVKI